MRGKCSSLFSRHPNNDSLSRCPHTKIIKIMTILSFPRKPAIVRPSFIFFKYNFKKECFYHDLHQPNRVPKLRLIYELWRSTMISSFSESPPLPDHFFFSLKYNFKKECFYHDFRKSNRVPKLRPICRLWIK